MVTFIEETHQYFNEKGEEYRSGTGFLHLFQKEFDSIGVATKVSKKTGRPIDDILADWKQNSVNACEYGTAIHLVMENYITKSERKIEHELLYSSYEKITGGLTKWSERVHSEKLLWNDEYKIAGTADLIIDHKNNEFSVGDFKTNKKINFSSDWGERMLDPIGHLSDCNYNLYSLQLSLYAYMYSLLTGRKCRRVFLMHLGELGWKEITANYMKFEVMAMLRSYKLKMTK